MATTAAASEALTNRALRVKRTKVFPQKRYGQIGAALYSKAERFSRRSLCDLPVTSGSRRNARGV